MRNKFWAVIFIVLVFVIQVTQAQTFQNNAFKGNEKLTYTASYFMSGLWTDMGQIEMFTLPVNYKGQNLYKLNVTASTYTSWDHFFRARDLYQSWVNPQTGQPYFYNRDVDEGGFKIKVRYVFSRKLGTVSSTMKVNNRPVKKNTVKITNSTFDLASALYYLRNINFSKDKTGAVHKIEVLIDGKLTVIYAKYRGVEELNTASFGKKKCYKIGVSLQEEKIMKNSANNNIWLTADTNKVPVLIKATIPVGNIQVRLKSHSGLRN